MAKMLGQWKGSLWGGHLCLCTMWPGIEFGNYLGNNHTCRSAVHKILPSKWSDKLQVWFFLVEKENKMWTNERDSSSFQNNKLQVVWFRLLLNMHRLCLHVSDSVKIKDSVRNPNNLYSVGSSVVQQMSGTDSILCSLFLAQLLQPCLLKLQAISIMKTVVPANQNSPKNHKMWVSGVRVRKGRRA